MDNAIESLKSQISTSKEQIKSLTSSSYLALGSNDFSTPFSHHIPPNLWHSIPHHRIGKRGYPRRKLKFDCRSPISKKSSVHWNWVLWLFLRMKNVNESTRNWQKLRRCIIHVGRSYFSLRRMQTVMIVWRYDGDVSRELGTGGMGGIGREVGNWGR